MYSFSHGGGCWTLKCVAQRSCLHSCRFLKPSRAYTSAAFSSWPCWVEPLSIQVSVGPERVLQRMPPYLAYSDVKLLSKLRICSLSNLPSSSPSTGGGAWSLKRGKYCTHLKERQGKEREQRLVSCSLLSRNFTKQVHLESISSYMRDRKVIVECQHEFIQSKSCLTNPVDLTMRWQHMWRRVKENCT